MREWKIRPAPARRLTPILIPQILAMPEVRRQWSILPAALLSKLHSHNDGAPAHHILQPIQVGRPGTAALASGPSIWCHDGEGPLESDVFSTAGPGSGAPGVAFSPGGAYALSTYSVLRICHPAVG